MDYPTHSVVCVFVEKGVRIQTGKIKFVGGTDIDASARAAANKYLSSMKRRVPYSIESLTVKPLPAPKLGAKLNKQHDYVSLRAVFLDGTITMTTSWGGLKASGDFVRHPDSDRLFDAACAYEKRHKCNVVGVMEALCADANSCHEFFAFVDKAVLTLANAPGPKALA